MKLLHIDTELADRCENQFSQKRRSIAVKEPIQGTSHPIIVEKGCLSLLQTEEIRLRPCGLLQVGVDGLTFVHDDIA